MRLQQCDCQREASLSYQRGRGTRTRGEEGWKREETAGWRREGRGDEEGWRGTEERKGAGVGGLEEKGKGQREAVM